MVLHLHPCPFLQVFHIFIFYIFHICKQISKNYPQLRFTIPSCWIYVCTYPKTHVTPPNASNFPHSTTHSLLEPPPKQRNWSMLPVRQISWTLLTVSLLEKIIILHAPAVTLTYFSPVFHFGTPWKRQKIKGFLTF